VAQTWLGLETDHHSQGVDIDLAALKIAKRRLESAKRKDRLAVLLQSPSFSTAGNVFQADIDPGSESEELRDPSAVASSSTWAEGAASDRFERRFQARLAKERAKVANSLKDGSKGRDQIQTLTLLHADVLELPLLGAELAAPDIVYAGNYALSYFHDRKTLIAYLKQCRRTLRRGTGTLIVDPFAGPTGWDAVSVEERREQDQLWEKFATEKGFFRAGEVRAPSPLKDDVLEFWQPEGEFAAHNAECSSSDWRQWPRGRLVLVRKGNVGGGYEYWREDGPLDYATNRFRMSLSFRFRDGSWLRDYFSYDFRVWSLREITEAMHEVGFERVSVHAIPRTVASVELDAGIERQENAGDDGDVEVAPAANSHNDDTDDGLEGMADLMRQTEVNEGEKHSYKELGTAEKLFAKRCFGTYVVACMPSDGS
jgi:hypothetical protein